MRKVKREQIPFEMIKVIEDEIRKMKRESKTIREPTRTEAWRRIADRMTRQLFK
jgi:hypothetical protein